MSNLASPAESGRGKSLGNELSSPGGYFTPSSMGKKFKPTSTSGSDSGVELTSLSPFNRHGHHAAQMLHELAELLKSRKPASVFVYVSTGASASVCAPASASASASAPASKLATVLSLYWGLSAPLCRFLSRPPLQPLRLATIWLSRNRNSVRSSFSASLYEKNFASFRPRVSLQVNETYYRKSD